MKAQIYPLVVRPADLDISTEFRSQTNNVGKNKFASALTENAISRRTVQTLTDARRAYERLMDRDLIVNVVTETTNIHALGIGHLLHNAVRKRYCQHEDIGSLFDAVLREELESDADTPITRHRFITRMRQLGQIPEGLTDRHLKPMGTTPCVKSISALISDRARIPFDDITSQSRRKNVVRARFQAIWVMRNVCGHSLSMIGECMGNRDHTTILNSINKVAINMRADMAYRREIEALCESADAIGVIQNRNLLLRSIQPI